MNHLASKKIVLVIVEGASDDTALGVALNQVFDKDSVYIHIIHGDITTRKGVNSQNIVSKIGDEVKGYAKSQHYKASDFKQIIHIVDTDAAYIPDVNIIEDTALEEVTYEDDGIYTANVEAIKDRNKTKRDNLYRLRTQGAVWEYPIVFIICHAIWITSFIIKETVLMKRKKMMPMHLLSNTRVIEMDLLNSSVNLLSL